MTVLPVVERELRAEARHSSTYWLRVIGAATLLGAALLCSLEEGFQDRQGGRLFYVLHQTLFWSIWILVPLLTGDCISRERREGTLGLLFLTPLRARDIVVAKGLAHGMKGLTVCLAALPVVVVPLLMGGVEWRIALASVMMNLTALCWTSSAGVLASSRNRSLSGSLCWSALWAFLLFWVMVWLCGFLFLSFLFAPGRGFGTTMSYMASGLVAVLNFFDMWSWSLRRVAPPAGSAWLWLYTWLLGLSVVALVGAWQIAAWNVRRVWQENPPSERRRKLEQKLFTPAYGLRFFRRWMRWLLDRNPVGWLEQRTWSGRLVSWSWIAVTISLFSWSLNSLAHQSGLRVVGGFVPPLLILSIAVSSSGSFRRERELGMMELLLVTPLRVGQIIAGRIRGLWGQFLPAVLLMMAMWFYLVAGTGLGAAWHDQMMTGGFMLWILGFSLVTMPVTGLYFSLRCRHYIVALFFSLFVGVFLPFFAMVSLYEGLEVTDAVMAFVLVPVVTVPTIGACIYAAWQVEEYGTTFWRAAGFLFFLVAYFVLANAVSDRDLFGNVLRGDRAAGLLFFPALQCAVATLCGVRLHYLLKKRTFAFHV